MKFEKNEKKTLFGRFLQVVFFGLGFSMPTLITNIKIEGCMYLLSTERSISLL